MVKKSEKKKVPCQNKRAAISDESQKSSPSNQQAQTCQNTKGINKSRGRPKKQSNNQGQEKLKIQNNPISQLQISLLKHFSENQLDHGLALNEEQKNIVFGKQIPTEEFDIEHQKAKALQSSKESIEHFKDILALPESQVCYFFVQIGSMVPPQFSSEIYSLLNSVVLSVARNQSMEKLEQRAENLFNNLNYINMKAFVKSKKYIVQLSEPKVAREKFKKTFLNFWQQINKIKQNPQCLKQVLQQERKLDQKLKTIIDHE